MVDVLVLLWSALTRLFRSRARLEAEILVLRQLINVLRRKSPKRLAFGSFDRMVFVGLYRLVPGTVAPSIVRPETVIREMLDQVVVLGERHLHGISQRGPYASVAEQGRPGSARSSGRRPDYCEASYRWTASPIRSDLICDKDRCCTVVKGGNSFGSMRHWQQLWAMTDRRVGL